ncbi:hypothetical protein [Serratia bockelmannii]|uniref:hypothetical protein n=1 Tax=Serratia bockelmannii TaxID=2703793 RepID=UPI003CEC1970
MNTLADRYYRDTHYPIPHADFLRLQHAHATGVLFLDLLDTLDQVFLERFSAKFRDWF